MDVLGPYTVAQLQAIADRWGPAASKGTAVRSAASLGGGGSLQGYSEFNDRPLVLLWRDAPTFGHFILLHWRLVRGKPVFELFDPLGVEIGGSSWENYMTDPGGLNGVGLNGLVAAVIDAGHEATYTPLSAAPQDPHTFSCGLWCLLRAAFPEASPTDFRKEARR